ncbi:MAG TPA: DUF2845 domain-containing protein [Candidatus Manganitrophaceae bacterium]
MSNKPGPPSQSTDPTATVGAETDVAPVGRAFAVAASANLPVIVLSLFWKRFNTKGAVLGLATGQKRFKGNSKMTALDWPKLLMILTLGAFFFGEREKSLFACDEPMISIGQTKEEVRSKCGEPASKEKRKIILLKGTRAAQSIEEWSYNPGPQQFIRILQFKNGRLARIETGGYGWTPDGSVDFGCEKTVLSNGATKLEVKERCGKPTTISKQKGHSREEWRYNLGPSRFVRIYQFKNGRLVEMKTGEYGE